MRELGLKAKLFIYQSVYIPTLIFCSGALGGDQRMRSGIQVAEICLLEVLFLCVLRIHLDQDAYCRPPFGGFKSCVQVDGDWWLDCEYTRGITYPRWPGNAAGVPRMS